MVKVKRHGSTGIVVYEEADTPEKYFAGAEAFRYVRLGPLMMFRTRRAIRLVVKKAARTDVRLSRLENVLDLVSKDLGEGGG